MSHSLLQLAQLQAAIEKQIAESIERNVNGKIRRLDEKIDLYIKVDTEWKSADKEWKKTAQPTVDMGQNAIGFGKVLKWVLVTGIAIISFVKLFK